MNPWLVGAEIAAAAAAVLWAVGFVGVLPAAVVPPYLALALGAAVGMLLQAWFPLPGVPELSFLFTAVGTYAGFAWGGWPV